MDGAFSALISSVPLHLFRNEWIRAKRSHTAANCGGSVAVTVWSIFLMTREAQTLEMTELQGFLCFRSLFSRYIIAISSVVAMFVAVVLVHCAAETLAGDTISEPIQRATYFFIYFSFHFQQLCVKHVSCWSWEELNNTDFVFDKFPFWLIGEIWYNLTDYWLTDWLLVVTVTRFIPKLHRI